MLAVINKKYRLPLGEGPPPNSFTASWITARVVQASQNLNPLAGARPNIHAIQQVANDGNRVSASFQHSRRVFQPDSPNCDNRLVNDFGNLLKTAETDDRIRVFLRRSRKNRSNGYVVDRQFIGFDCLLRIMCLNPNHPLRAENRLAGSRGQVPS